MPLEPGDRGIVEVAAWPELVRGSWGCARCGRSFPSDRSRRVVYRHPDGDRYAFAVCPDCGSQLQPVRATIDLAALERQRHSFDLAPVVSLVHYVLRHRAPDQPGRLRIRSADLHVLAATFNTTPRAFALALDAGGVAAGADQ